MEQKRGNFSGNLGFVLAAAGAAVGLGNIWKFPHLAGSSGGGLFIIIYLVLLAVMGIPLILAETAIGRRGQKDAMHSFVEIAQSRGYKNKTVWSIVGGIGVLISFIIFTYYPVVGGWVVEYMVKSVTVPLGTINMDTFVAMISTPWSSIIYTFIFFFAMYIIVVRGISGGIEKANKIMMPALFIILIIVVIRAITLPGAIEGIKFLWVPNMENVKNAGGFGKVALAALGQLFFSLSIGQGIMITYASYLKKDTNLMKNATMIPIMDTGVALLAGMAVLPAVFAFGIEPSSGAGLMFGTLPQVFHNFGAVFGPIFMFLFFVLVLFAALTSAISLLEVVSCFVIDTFKWERKKAVTIMALVGFLLAIINIMSYGPWGDLMIGGMVLFDFLGYLTDKILIPLCSLSVCIFIGYIWNPQNALKEITNEGALTFKLFSAWSVLVKYIIPILIITIMVMGFVNA